LHTVLHVTISNMKVTISGVFYYDVNVTTWEYVCVEVTSTWRNMKSVPILMNTFWFRS